MFLGRREPETAEDRGICPMRKIPFQITIEGRPLHPESYFAPGGPFAYERNEVLFGRFDLTLPLVVRIDHEEDRPLHLYSAVCSNIRRERGCLRFTVRRPGQMIVLGEGLPRLLLAADPAGCWRRPQGALNASDVGISANSSALQCEAMNAAMAELSARGGGTLYLPSGTYPVATVRMQSNVTLHLEEGAVLRATTEIGAYPVDPEGVLYTELPGSLIPGPRRRVVYWENCENSALVGRGMVDGQGSELRRLTLGSEAGRPLINLMKFVKAKGCRVEGVTLADSEFWNTHVLLSEDVTFDFVKVINEQPPPGWAVFLGDRWKTVFWNNTDGINPDSSQRVEIKNSLFHTGDDCVAVKNTGTYKNEIRDVEEIYVHDNLMLCGTTPMKIGTETRGDLIHNIRFVNMIVARCSRVCACELKDGATLRDLVVENVRVGECNRPFDFEIMLRQDEEGQTLFSQLDGAVLRNINIERYRTEGAHWYCHIRGHDRDHRIRNLRIENVSLAGRHLTSPEDEDLILNEYIEDIVIRGREEVSGMPVSSDQLDPSPD